MSNFSKYIPEDLAKELLQYGMPLHKYGLGSYDGKPYFDTEDEDSPNWEDCDRYQIPTYGKVIDWFSEWGIYITFDVFFTFALADRIGYLWRISFIDESNGDVKLKTISEEKICNDGEGCGGSFELDANAAIKYAMKLKKKI